MKRLAYLLTLSAIMAASALNSNAATPEQMERAHVAAVKACLRNMNNGSDYLEKLNPKSMADLEKNLKKTEKENIAALKKIQMPAKEDYASWDKKKFEDYWTKTFVKATPVKTTGYCANQIKSAISGIQVTKDDSKPAEDAKPEAKPAEAAASDDAKPAETPAADEAQTDPAATEPASEEIVAQEEVMQEGEMVPVPTEEVKPQAPEAPKKKDSNTASIVVLCILVLVVVALVGYALNVMKKNKARQSAAARPSRRRAPKRDYADYDDYKAPATTVQADPEEESPFAAYSSAPEPEPVKAPDPRDREIERLRTEIASLQSQMKARPAAPERADAPRRVPRIIYLAQANADGVFTRADARYNMGNSIFKLVTTDGVSGSFSVIEDPTVFELALMMPSDFLVNACTGRNLQLSEGARAIVNEASGTAIFENGRWRVSRKAQIRYSR